MPNYRVKKRGLAESIYEDGLLVEGIIVDLNLPDKHYPRDTTPHVDLANAKAVIIVNGKTITDVPVDLESTD